MDNLLLNLTIGATISGAFKTAFKTAESSIKGLDSQTEMLMARQQRVGDVMAQSMARPHRNLQKWHNQYQLIGQAIDRNKRAQDRLNSAMSVHNKVDGYKQNMQSGMMTEATKLAVIGTPLVASAKAAIEFETSMAEVNKTVGFDGKASLTAFGDELKSLSTQIPVSVSGLASIAATGGQLGVAREHLIGFTKDVSEMSVAFDMMPEAAGDNMAKLMNAMGEPITAMREYGDAINAVSNSSPAKAREIIESLGRVGSTGKNFGLVKEEIIALNGAFIATGSAPEVAATSVKGMLTTLSTLDPKSKKQRASLNKLGLGFEEFSTLVKTKPQEAIMTMLNSVNQLPKSERIGALTGLFGKEYAGQIATLSGGIDTYTDQLKTLQAVDANGKPLYFGSMAKEFAIISGTTANKIQLFKSNLNLLAINIGDALIPSINQAMIALQPMIQGFANFAKAHPQLISGLVGIAVGAIALKLVMFSLGFVFLGVVSSFTKIYVVMARMKSAMAFLKGLRALGTFAPMARKLSVALGFVGRAFTVLRMIVMANPIIAAVTLIATAAYLIYKNWTPIKAFFSGIWSRLKAFANSGVSNILMTLAKFSPLGLFVRAFVAVFDYFSGLAGKFRGYGANIIQGLIGGITAKFDVLKAKVSAMASLVSGVFTGKMEINSPSRLFRRFGMGISQGVAMGITDQTPTAIKASDAMANRLAQTQYSNRVLGSQSMASGTSTGTIHFSPTINVTVEVGGDVAGQVQQGLATGQEAFERMLERVEANRSRRAFA